MILLREKLFLPFWCDKFEKIVQNEPQSATSAPCPATRAHAELPYCAGTTTTRRASARCFPTAAAEATRTTSSRARIAKRAATRRDLQEVNSGSFCYLFSQHLTSGAWHVFFIWTNGDVFIHIFNFLTPCMNPENVNTQFLTHVVYTLTDVCTGAAPSQETCGGDQKLARWRFESESNRCLPFYTKGCDPNNRNSFIAENHCLHVCPPKQGKRHIHTNTHNWLQFTEIYFDTLHFYIFVWQTLLKIIQIWCNGRE